MKKHLRPRKVRPYFQTIIFVFPGFHRRCKVSNTWWFIPRPTGALPRFHMVNPSSLLLISRPHVHPHQLWSKPTCLVCIHDPATMPKALCGPHVQLAVRVREVEGGCGECEEPRKEAGEVLKFPGELTIFNVGDVEEVPCRGKE
jgi:hypothetical protein